MPLDPSFWTADPEVKPKPEPEPEPEPESERWRPRPLFVQMLGRTKRTKPIGQVTNLKAHEGGGKSTPIFDMGTSGFDRDLITTGMTGTFEATEVKIDYAALETAMLAQMTKD